MFHPSMPTSGRLSTFRRSDAALRATAATAAVVFAALALVGVVAALIPVTVSSTPAPVLVGCSDGTGCAVPPSSGRVLTVTVRWVHPQPPLGDDPGADL